MTAGVHARRIRLACSRDLLPSSAFFSRRVNFFVALLNIFVALYEKNVFWVSHVRYQCCNPSGDLLPSLTFSSRFVNFFVALLNLFFALRQPPLTRRKHTGLTTSDMSVAILCSKCSALALSNCYIFVFHHVLYTTVSRFLSDTLCQSCLISPNFLITPLGQQGYPPYHACAFPS